MGWPDEDCEQQFVLPAAQRRRKEARLPENVPCHYAYRTFSVGLFQLKNPLRDSISIERRKAV
jgi:hypothetical protein